jgi:hypothetical protein
MKVAELRNGEAVKNSGQSGEHDFPRNQNGMLGFKHYAVFPQSQGASGGYSGSSLKKSASS